MSVSMNLFIYLFSVFLYIYVISIYTYFLFVSLVSSLVYCVLFASNVRFMLSLPCTANTVMSTTQKGPHVQFCQIRQLR